MIIRFDLEKCDFNVKSKTFDRSQVLSDFALTWTMAFFSFFKKEEEDDEKCTKSNITYRITISTLFT